LLRQRSVLPCALFATTLLFISTYTTARKAILDIAWYKQRPLGRRAWDTWPGLSHRRKGTYGDSALAPERLLSMAYHIRLCHFLILPDY
jgi:hypothetical protein